MKLSLLLASVVAAVSFPQLAHADGGQIVGARWESSASILAVHKAACSFDAASTFDGAVHAFDVHVFGARCPNRPHDDEHAIPLRVRLEHGDKDFIVVETTVPEGVDGKKLHTAVLEIATEVQLRVDRALASDAVAAVVRPTTVAPPSTNAPAPNDVWARDAQRDWYGTRPKYASRGLMAGGIVLIIAGGLATFGGAISALSTPSYGNAGPAAFVLASGLAGLASGIPMLVIGGKKVPAVTASVSPTGGNLRVTF